MQSPNGRDRQLFEKLAARYGFSPDGVASMLASVAVGNGRMAQFDHPDFGGRGQWMRGGMTMVADMFDSSLKARVSGLCSDLAEVPAAAETTPQAAADRTNPTAAEIMNPAAAETTEPAVADTTVPPLADKTKPAVAGVTQDAGSPWWPHEFGTPNSAGAQNRTRYAYFAAARRLAIEADGRPTLYDTLDHQINGVAQAQSTGSSLNFSTNRGDIDLSTLPIVSDAIATAARDPRPPQADRVPSANNAARESGSTPPSTDPFAAIEKLALLRGSGILSDDEFTTKKADLLRRI